MCADCGCGCKKGKPAAGCKCDCKTCRDSRVEKMAQFFEDYDVEKAFNPMSGVKAIKGALNTVKSSGFKSGVGQLRGKLAQSGSNMVQRGNSAFSSTTNAGKLQSVGRNLTGRAMQYSAANPGKAAAIGAAGGAGLIGTGAAIKKSDSRKSKHKAKPGRILTGAFFPGVHGAIAGKNGHKLKAAGYEFGGALATSPLGLPAVGAGVGTHFADKQGHYKPIKKNHLGETVDYSMEELSKARASLEALKAAMITRDAARTAAGSARGQANRARESGARAVRRAQGATIAAGMQARGAAAAARNAYREAPRKAQLAALRNDIRARNFITRNPYLATGGAAYVASDVTRAHYKKNRNIKKNYSNVSAFGVEH